MTTRGQRDIQTGGNGGGNGTYRVFGCPELPPSFANRSRFRHGRKPSRRVRSPSERHRLRLKFWQVLLSRPRAKTTRHANIAVSGEYHYIGAGSGVRGVPFNYVIRQDEDTVELYIDRGSGMTEENKRIFDRLHAHRRDQRDIEKAFGCELSWQRPDDKRACRVAYTVTGAGWKSKESKWPGFQDAMIRLEKALLPQLAKLKTELASEGA
jgi:hypothetical protein